MTLTDIGGDTALDTAISGDEGAEPLLMICGTSQSFAFERPEEFVPLVLGFLGDSTLS